MGYNGNNRKLKSDMFPKKKFSKKELDFGIGLLLAPIGLIGDLLEDLPIPNVVYAIGYIFVSLVFNSLLIGCFNFAIDAWDSTFGSIFIFLIIIPIAIWGSSCILHNIIYY